MERFLQSDFFYHFRNAPVAIVSFITISLIFVAAIFANFIAPTNPFDPSSLNLMNGFTPPLEPNEFTGEIFFLGTDDQGRDLFSTILYGLRISLFVGLMAVLLALIMGVFLGLIAGFLGGWIDSIIMRFADIQMTFPSILVAMLIYGVAKGILPPDLRYEMSISVLILSIGLSEWVPFARTVRGSTLVEKEKEYVTAAKMIGLSKNQIIVKHILPNALTPVVTYAPFALIGNISALVSLDYLGFGLQPPTPSWGELINQAAGNLQNWHLVVFPLIFLAVTLFLITLISEGVRAAFDPKIHSRLR